MLIISQIVRGAFQSAYLGYYAHERHAGQGYMREAMAQTVAHAFGPLALHRLEANIQPGNAASIALAPLGRLPARGLLPALPADRRAVARPRALRDHGRRPRRSARRARAAGRRAAPRGSRAGPVSAADRRELGLGHDGLRRSAGSGCGGASSASSSGQPREVLAQRLQHRRRVERRRRVEDRVQPQRPRPDRADLLAAVQARDPGRVAAQQLRREVAERADHLRPDQLELPEQVAPGSCRSPAAADRGCRAGGT